MNKKVIVIVALAGIQNAQAIEWLKVFAALPLIQKVYASYVAQKSSKRQRSMIMPVEQETKLTKKNFAEQKQPATNCYGLKVSANIAGNITIEVHDKAEIVVNATAKGTVLDHVTYKLERSTEGVSTVFLLNSYDNTPSSKSLLNRLFFWRNEPPKQSENSLDFTIKIPTFFNHFTHDSFVKGDFTFLAYGLTEAACICALKGKGGNINVNNFKGKLDASTTHGSIVNYNHTGLLLLKTNNGDATVTNWSITNPKTVVSSISTDDGNIKVELPENIKITTKNSTNVIYKKILHSSPTIMNFAKGSGLHQLTVSTPGKIELD